VFAVACLSCHSTRYITMQPPLNQAKWEESVRKMAKTYGAPIAEEQVVPIAQYLVAARQADPSAWETLAVTPPKTSVDAAVLRSQADAKHGETLYAQHCASCHGGDGKSNTVAAQPQLPRPTDLTSGRFTAEAIAAAVVRGVRGTAMPAFPTLGPTDVRDLTYYTQQFSPRGDDGGSPAASAEDGKKLYAANCASCHGPTGAGDGFAAPPLARMPANFHARQPSADRAVDVISNGVAGTAMPGWKVKLTEPQRAAVAAYIRGFYEAGESK